MTQRLDDYWLVFGLQRLYMPARNLICIDINDTHNGFRLSVALDLYLKLKGTDKDKTFTRTASGDTEYAIQVLGNKIKQL